MNRRFTDEEAVRLFLTNDLRQHELVITYLHREYGPGIIRLIVRMGGSREDGEEKLNDALLDLLANVRSGSFQLWKTVKLSTYLVTLAKYNWLNKNRKNTPRPNDMVDINDVSVIQLAQEEAVSNDRKDAFDELVKRLTGKCQKLLQAVVDGFSMQEIATMLNLGNAKNAKAHKYQCMKKLNELRMK